ncbi:MAG: EFR1 family ferrodoxin [Thermodesulfobacteriota bacterium]|nr:EFR1 family ferrodoxin [Thermodesulfobacteriota bacterium]
MEPKSIVFFFSPGGSTRCISEVITETLNKLGKKPLTFDISREDQLHNLQRHLNDLPARSCLYVGSPVYACHPAPPITQVLSQISKGDGCYAVPFVTWGAVTSGVALHDMGKLLTAKEYTIIGAAKIVAVHSLTWKFHSPLGNGHPDQEDERLVKGLVERVCKKLSNDPVETLSLEMLNYQPAEAQKVMEHASIEKAKKLLPPRQLDRELCTGCGICADICPIHTITCEFYPDFGPECIYCFNCVRHCPEEAIKADFSQMEEILRNRVKENAEDPLSQIFI